MYNDEFAKKLCNGYRLTSVQVIYWMPDYTDILQEFFWQTLDLQPKYPRVKKFLTHWEDNIEAKIKDVFICQDDNTAPSDWRNVIDLGRL